VPLAPRPPHVRLLKRFGGLPGGARLREIPTFGYHGSKANLAAVVSTMFPLHGDRFIEPFCGRGNVYFHVAQTRDYKRFWLNDIKTYKFLLGLRRADEVVRGPISVPLFRRIKAAALAGEDYLQLKPSWKINVHLMEQLLVWSGGYFSQAGSSPRGFKLPSVWGHFLRCLKAYMVMKRTNPRITNWDYRDVLAECGTGDCVYLDPRYEKIEKMPYPNINHRELCRILIRAKYRWVLSGYENETYRILGEPVYRTWIPRGMSRLRNVKGKRLEAEECIWSNFTPPLLLDYTSIIRSLKMDDATLLEQWIKDREELDAAIQLLRRTIQRNFAAAPKRSYTRGNKEQIITVLKKSHHKKAATAQPGSKKGTMSAAARKRISIAQKLRWAKLKAGKK